MALVVCVSTIVTEEAHRVVRGNVLRVVLDELLGAIPESGNGVNILIQTENEAVLLLVLGHETEGVVMNVAVELNTGLDSPVVLVVEHQGLTEEESGLESTHVTIADGVTVDNLPLRHILANLLGLVLINPLGERPVLTGDLAIVGLARNQGAGDLLEGSIKGLIVQEDPVISISAVESILDLANGLGDIPHIAVSGQCDEGCVHSGTRRNTEKVIPAGHFGGQGKRKVLRIADKRRLRRGLVGRPLDGSLGITRTLPWLLSRRLG